MQQENYIACLVNTRAQRQTGKDKQTVKHKQKDKHRAKHTKTQTHRKTHAHRRTHKRTSYIRKYSETVNIMANTDISTCFLKTKSKEPCLLHLGSYYMVN